MEYIAGIATGLVFFALLGGAYYLGTRRSKPVKKAEQMNDEEKRRAAQLRKEYAEIMSYDADKARGGNS